MIFAPHEKNCISYPPHEPTMSTTAPIPNPLSVQDNNVPITIANVEIKVEDQNGAPPSAQSTNNNTTALNLFAPAQGDFDDQGAYDIDINELFHDCYFEEYNPTLEEDHTIPSLPPPTPKVESALPDIVSSKTEPENVLPQKRSSPDNVVYSAQPIVPAAQVIQPLQQVIPPTQYQYPQSLIPTHQPPSFSSATSPFVDEFASSNDTNSVMSELVI